MAGSSTNDKSPAPQVFDRGIVRLRRARGGPGPHDFLHRHVAEEISDRLTAIDRNFEVALELGARTGEFAASEMGQRIPYLFQSDLVLPSRPARPSFIADEEHLPVGLETLDLVVAGLTLHSVNDLPGALVQIRASLKPDGLFIGTIMGGDTLRELRTALMEAELETTGGASPRVAPFADVRDAGHLLQRAGLALPVTDADTLTVRYSSFFALLNDLRAMGEANALTERRRMPLRRDTLLRAGEIYAERFSDDDGKLRATFEIIYLAGWAPHESQQQPLRPGSARASLAEALGTTERPAGDKTKN